LSFSIRHLNGTPNVSPIPKRHAITRQQSQRNRHSDRVRSGTAQVFQLQLKAFTESWEPENVIFDPWIDEAASERREAFTRDRQTGAG
jgi:hypothetical protein